MLTVSFVIAGIYWTLTASPKAAEVIGIFSPPEEDEKPPSQPEPAEVPSQSETKKPPEPEKQEVTPSKPEETPREFPEKETPKALRPVIRQADRTYFDDALFIGDSRTMGLYEYGDLRNAVVIADSGMSVYKVWNEEIKGEDGSAENLQSILENHTFGKVYVMLGINELGYEFGPTVKKYEELVGTIRELQPEAIIYLQANLHITKEKSDSSDIFNNENINRFNEAVEKMADDNQVFYLDVNPLFDDEEHCLSVDYTTDKVHVLGKYYIDWTDWLLENAVFYE